MCWCDKTRLMFWGKLFMLAFAIGAVIAIILAGVNFNLTFGDFRKNGWKSLAAVELASIIYVFIMIVVGFLTFWFDKLLITITVSNN